MLPAELRGLDTLIRAVELVQPGSEVAAAGRFRADARRRGFTLSVPDALIAASADALAATIITKNIRDFALTPVPVEGYQVSRRICLGGIGGRSCRHARCRRTHKTAPQRGRRSGS